MTLTLTKLKIKAQKQLRQLNLDIQLPGHQFCLTKLFWKTLMTLLQALEKCGYPDVTQPKIIQHLVHWDI